MRSRRASRSGSSSASSRPRWRSGSASDSSRGRWPHQASVRRHAPAQHFRVVVAADAIGEGAVERQLRPVVLEAVGDGAEGAGHGRGVDHGHHRQLEADGESARGRLAVEQTHDAFDEDEVGLARCTREAPGRVCFAAHPEIEILAGRAAGDVVDHRVDEVGAALEHAHAASLPRVQARQRRRRRWSCRWPEAGAAINSAGAAAITTRRPAWPSRRRR